MKKKLYEEIVLFYGAIKWLILSTIIGIIVGIGVTVFLKLLHISINLTSKFEYYYLLLPFALFITALIIEKITPEAKGHGTEKVIESIHKRNGKINPLVVPIKLIGTIITLSAGGSAGKEGPSAQIGAGLASIFADIFKLDDRDRKKLVICGISAGFASVFGTPIAGAIFGIEVLIVGNMFYEALLPSFIAGIVSFQVSSKLGISYSYHPLSFNYSFNELHFAEAIIAGIFLGLVSIIFIETLNFFEDIYKKLKIWNPVKGLIGGSILVLLTLIFSKNFLGLGIDTIERALNGERIAWYFFLVKIIFTIITLSFGGSGGIITPIFFIGSTAGNFLANFLHFDRATLSAIGMINLLASVTNTPIASSIMFIELFGKNNAYYAIISCIIAFIINGERSVYPSQVIQIRKRRLAGNHSLLKKLLKTRKQS